MAAEWGSCPACYYHTNRAGSCDQENYRQPETTCKFFRPAKLRGKAKRKTGGKRP